MKKKQDETDYSIEDFLERNDKRNFDENCDISETNNLVTEFNFFGILRAKIRRQINQV